MDRVLQRQPSDVLQKIPNDRILQRQPSDNIHLLIAQCDRMYRNASNESGISVQFPDRNLLRQGSDNSVNLAYDSGFMRQNSEGPGIWLPMGAENNIVFFKSK